MTDVHHTFGLDPSRTDVLAYTLSEGYPSDKPLAVIERLNRRPFDEVVHRGGW